MNEVKVRKGDHVDKALRRLKKVLGRENMFKELRKRRHYRKPSAVGREKSKIAQFQAMLRQRYADL